MGPEAPPAWIVAHYLPCALFSLKLSFATSSVGKTSLIPTPYAIKMAVVDVAFRLGYAEARVDEIIRDLRETPVRIAPPPRAVITNTFVKIRQEPKFPTPEEPYGSSIAYREVAFHDGVWAWAFDIRGKDDTFTIDLTRLLPHVSYIGKRGSFIQFSGMEYATSLDESFTQPLQNDQPWVLHRDAQVLQLDDFGPEAELEVLNSFSSKRAVRGRHRQFVETIVPMISVSSGPGFTEYQTSG